MTKVAPAPVIILASRGSHGSFLSALLGGHPDLCGAPHLNVLAFEQAYQQQLYSAVPRDSANHGLHRFLGQALVGEQSVQSVQVARRWLGVREAHSSLEIYTELASLVAPLRIVDYSPLYALNLESMRRVANAVPDAKIIHLVVNPLRHAMTLGPAVWQTINASLGYWGERGLNHPCMDSFEIGDHLVDWSVSPPVFDPQFSWYRTQNAARQLFSELPTERCIRVTAENLVANTSDELERLLTFLGLDYTADTLQNMVSNTDQTFTAPGPFDATIGVDYDMIGRTVADVAQTAIPEDVIDPDAPLVWRGDDDVLQPEVVDLAGDLGYRISS